MTVLADILDMRDLREAYLYANTPAYLFRRFRENASVQKLATALPISELTKAFNELRSKHPVGLEEIVQEYAILISLSLRDPAERAAIWDFHDSRLEWWQQIVSQIQSFSTPSNEISVSISPGIESNSESSHIVDPDSKGEATFSLV
jgi:hypothetical protein